MQILAKCVSNFCAQYEEVKELRCPELNDSMYEIPVRIICKVCGYQCAVVKEET